MDQVEAFNDWWEVYPRKVNRKRSLELWIALSEKNRATAVQKLSTDVQIWKREARAMQHIPTPETYLRRIASAPQPAYTQQGPLPTVAWPTAHQVAQRKADMQNWLKKLGR